MQVNKETYSRSNNFSSDIEITQTLQANDELFFRPSILKQSQRN